MTTALRLYEATKELLDPMLVELLDFADLLRQRKSSGAPQAGNTAQRIHQRLENLEGEGLPVHARQSSCALPNAQVDTVCD